MAWFAPDVGEAEILKRVLYSDADAENLTLRLYKNSVTPAESDTASSYTVADFTDYANVTLTSSQSGSTWGVPSTTGGVTSSTYATTATWVCGASGNTIYGMNILGASSGILLLVDAFSAGLTMSDGFTFSVDPKIGLE